MERAETLSALAAVARDARCVLLGAPGGGKSMFFRHLACGALDMSGNVWEWCRTAWRDNYKDYNSQADDSEEEPPDERRGRVLRGGSWDFTSVSMRASFRDWFHPQGRYYYVGFRLVVVPPF